MKKTSIEVNFPYLLQKRLGLFICAGEPEPKSTQELAEAFPAELFNQAAAKDVFGYEFCFEKLNFLDKFIMRRVKGRENPGPFLCYLYRISTR